MKKNDWIRLHHILKASSELEEILKQRKRADLSSDRLLMFSVIKLIEIIGEAASKISLETKEQYSYLPWQQMIRMRNRLIHGYFDVNLNIIWKTAVENIPSIKNQITFILNNDQQLSE